MLHLGNLFEKSGMDTEAVQTYMVLIKNKQFDRAGLIRTPLTPLTLLTLPW